MKKYLALCLLAGLAGSVYADNTLMQPTGFMNGPKLYVGGSLGLPNRAIHAMTLFLMGSATARILPGKPLVASVPTPCWGLKSAITNWVKPA